MPGWRPASHPGGSRASLHLWFSHPSFFPSPTTKNKPKTPEFYFLLPRVHLSSPNPPPAAHYPRSLPPSSSSSHPFFFSKKQQILFCLKKHHSILTQELETSTEAGFVTFRVYHKLAWFRVRVCHKLACFRCLGFRMLVRPTWHLVFWAFQIKICRLKS